MRTRWARLSMLACVLTQVGLMSFAPFAYSASVLVPSPQITAMLRVKQVMIGYGNGDMRWMNTITRAEAVKLLLAAIGEVAPSLSRSPAAFSDVSRSHWAFGHITMAAEMGLVRGRPGNVFDPEQGVTMAEFMVMVSRVYGSLGSEAGMADGRIKVEPSWASAEIVGWPDLVEMVTGSSWEVDLDYPASRGEVGTLTGRMMERLGLAHDLTGILQQIVPDKARIVLAIEDGAPPIEISLAGEALWFFEGAAVEPTVLVGSRISIVFDDAGKASVIVWRSM